MKKILGLTIAVVLIIGLVAGGTWAYFSDTETSTGNIFTAGVIDLEVDCDGDTIFAATDDPLPAIFEYLPVNDIKPGDFGEVTLSLHLKADSNNADLWMQVQSLTDYGGLNPESETPGDDVISDAILVKLWLDNGDNIYQAGETVLYDGTLAGLFTAGPGNDGKFTVEANAVACTVYYVGWSWELPGTVGNEAQGDYCTFTIVFGADQSTGPVQYTLTTNASPPEGGSTTGDGSYDEGTYAAITATASTGYHFTGWTGEGITDPSSASTTVLIDKDKTVTAHFAANASPTNTGWLSPAANSPGPSNWGFNTPTGAYTDGTGPDGWSSAESMPGTMAGKPFTVHQYYGYDFSAIPSGATINGIEVRLNAWRNTFATTGSMAVELSWDNGTSWTTTGYGTGTLNYGETTYYNGGASNTWGHTWTVGEIQTALRVRLTVTISGSNARVYLDWVPVRVTYTP